MSDTSYNDMDGFAEAVRDTAYFLWEEAGWPEGRADEFWYRALEIHYRSRAYQMWMRRQNEPTGERSTDQPTEPIGDVSKTDLSSDETYDLARGIEHERDA